MERLDRYDVDPERVYLTGISCGGIATWHCLGEHGSETVAAAVSISAQAIDALASAGCKLGRIPIWVVHGAKDDVVPVDFVEGQVEDFARAPTPSRSTSGSPSTRIPGTSPEIPRIRVRTSTSSPGSSGTAAADPRRGLVGGPRAVADSLRHPGGSGHERQL
jgi:hypothetical protein